MKKLNAIVIGAGVLGSSLTDELTRRGAQVTLIDDASVASGTSAATFAWVNSNGKAPDSYATLNYLGLQAHERAAADGASWFHQTGMIQVAQTPDEAEGYEQGLQEVICAEYGARPLSRQEVLDLEPNLDPTIVTSGAYYPREGWIDVQTMCHALVGRSVERGAVLRLFETVIEINDTEVTTRKIDGSSHRYVADVIIVAAGNGSPSILNSVGIDLPLIDPVANEAERNTPGTSVGIISTTGKIDSGIRHFVRANGIALRPGRNGGITYSDHPTGGKWAQDDPRTWEVPRILLDRVKALYPSMRDAVTQNVALGTRVLPSDGLTIVDWATSGAPVYVVATHSGVTLSAHLAETIAEEIISGHRHESLQPFGLDRFNFES